VDAKRLGNTASNTITRVDRSVRSRGIAPVATDVESTSVQTAVLVGHHKTLPVETLSRLSAAHTISSKEAPVIDKVSLTRIPFVELGTHERFQLTAWKQVIVFWIELLVKRCLHDCAAH
jgi:hypothetical protein